MILFFDNLIANLVIGMLPHKYCLADICLAVTTKGQEMKKSITRTRLRQIIKEELKIFLEAVTLDDIVSGIAKEKVNDSNKLQSALEKYAADGGEAAKGSLKDKESVEKIKTAYKEQGGDPKAVDDIVKGIVTGKIQASGDVASAAKQAAAALGNPEDAQKLAAITSTIKGGKSVDALGTEQLKVLARLAADFIFQDKADTLNAAKALAKVGAKK